MTRAHLFLVVSARTVMSRYAGSRSLVASVVSHKYLYNMTRGLYDTSSSDRSPQSFDI